ncbi:2-amino-4-hydroxy-6-hydroxymethyldihydropteridine diphosphokinase [Lysobacter sp. BMK333-48F3]|uniref:2-amino-4-hydroxy-6- hydroxymethyldihydropteridine diphosphokinase n=1 Tax=Lysobacter sp. BMK333-48F3 TaxID=2867962 RepID=UPI001C8BD8DA|nr:2-amino-4-hydroxy-6-hydroxymethyldihydropteridine diphosphokinase [Lysobacter sp. BMK333-48F3]MBX9403666.1 2-amino-4-hydroxy-6-hydroxymethyldihydropteridine diphosphokinase [Lysobacter sp. BMK333-48F3]
MHTVYIGLGSNLGDSAAVLRAALRALERLPDSRLLRASKLYRTPAWGRTDQPDFLNAVAALQTGLPAPRLLAAMLEIERDAGRSRLADRSDRWGPRTLDLDLLLYGEATIDAPGLHVPHPHLHERAFALVPLLEIAPEARIPDAGAARDCLARLGASDIRAVDIRALPADNL